MKPEDSIAQVQDYEQVKILAYQRQDEIVAALIKAGIDAWDPITALALSYHVSQIQGMEEAKKLREAKKVGVM